MLYPLELRAHLGVNVRFGTTYIRLPKEFPSLPPPPVSVMVSVGVSIAPTDRGPYLSNNSKLPLSRGRLLRSVACDPSLCFLHDCPDARL
jgi:hypothetical protein